VANFPKRTQIPEKVPKIPEYSGILELPEMPKGKSGIFGQALP
jgi:hypothetical protein